MYKIAQISLNNTSLDLANNSLHSEKTIQDLFLALINLQNLNDVSQLSITLSSNKSLSIVISKSQNILQINGQNSEDLWTDLASQLGVSQFSSNDLLGMFNNLNVSEQVLAALIRSFLQGFAPQALTLQQALLQVQQFNSPLINDYLTEYNTVQVLTSRLSKQKLVPEVISILEQALLQISQLKLQKDDVADLIQSLTALEQQLAAYSVINKPTLEQDALQFKQDLIKIREANLLSNTKSTQTNTQNNESDSKKVDFLEKFFVHKAWLNALQQEVQNTSLQITNKLNGVDYNQLINSLNQLINTVSNLAFLANSYEQLDLNASEFLKLRQELDTSKLKLIDLEQQLSSLDSYEEVLEVSEKLSVNNEPIALNLPAELIGAEFTNLYVDQNNQIGNLDDQDELQNVELTLPQLLNTYLWLRLNYLQNMQDKQNIPPVIIILPELFVTQLSITITTQLAKLVTELNQLIIWQTSK